MHKHDWLLLRSQPWWQKWPVGLLLAWAATYLPEPVPEPGVAKAEGFVAMIVILIIVLIAQEILRPKPEFEDARPAGNGDFQFVTATEGRPIPIIWGRNLLSSPNVVWYGDIQALPIHESVRTGWFSKEEFISGYQYTMGVQFGLCCGPDVELTRMWLGREQKWLVYDSDVSGVIAGGDRFDINEPELHFPTKGGVTATCDFYGGAYGQPQNDYLDNTARQLVAPMVDIPNYGGTCHLVMREMTSAAPTTDDGGAYIGNSTAVDPVSIELQRFPAVFTGQAAGEHKVPASTGKDCNPINVLYEILTDRDWGLGFLPGEIDTGPGSSFLSAADTMLTEVNGFAMVLDKQIPASQMIEEVERQIDGVLFLSQTTGKWQIKLARADYTVATLPALDETNCEFSDYARSTWEDTTNQLVVKFNKREDNYKESYAVAQDEANIIMQGAGSINTGRIVSGTISYPGCKLSSLASTLVWRSLRTNAYPLSRATFTVNREFWDLQPGDVFKWSNTELSIDEVPMRIIAIDFGVLTDNKITITAVQDIFQFLGPSFGDPPSSEWIPPVGTVIDYPTDERIAFEIPRAMLVRHPDWNGGIMSGIVQTNVPGWGSDVTSRIIAAAKRQGAETQIVMRERHHPTVPAGAYADAGKVTAFMEMGKLKANLSYSSTVPQATITIEPDASTQAEILAAIPTESASGLGENLTTVVKINDELMLVQLAAANGSDVDLQNVYRGAMDTVQATHSLGDKVYILNGASLLDTVFPLTDVVDLKFLPQSFNSTLAEGSATALQLTMDTRAPRPYPPSCIRYNGSSTNYGTPDLEGDGSGLNGYGVDVDWLRRNYLASDEVVNLTSDQTSLLSTDYEVEIRHTPYSASDVVATKTWASDVTGIASIFTRLEILNGSPNGSVQPLQFRIRSRHTAYSSYPNHQSLYETEHLVTPTSTLTGQVAMGKATWSNALPTAYAAAANGTYTVNIGAGYAATSVSYQINGGGWNVCIAAGAGTSGTIPGVSISDNIELRHDAAEGSANFVELQNPSATAVAYGIFQS